jgi:hypothetical protein
MVRERQVGAAGLDIERDAQVLGRDRRALHVPAWPPEAEAEAEAGRPRGLARPRGQPDQGIQRVLLPEPAGVAAVLGEQGNHRGGIKPGHRPERGIG